MNKFWCCFRSLLSNQYASCVREILKYGFVMYTKNIKYELIFKTAVYCTEIKNSFEFIKILKN